MHQGVWGQEPKHDGRPRRLGLLGETRSLCLQENEVTSDSPKTRNTLALLHAYQRVTLDRGVLLSEPMNKCMTLIKGRGRLVL